MLTKLAPVAALLATSALLCAASPKTDMDKLTQQWVTAIKTKDAKWIMGNTTPDFVVILQNGKKYTRDQATQSMKEMFTAITKVDRVEAKVTLVKVKGDAVIATVESLVHAYGNFGGKPGSFSDSATDEETWVKVKGQYKLKLDKTLKEVAKINNQVINGD